MNYKNIHDLIIDRAKNRNITIYTEKHHIIPKCLGGLNTDDNIVRLTAKEHFLIHKLLCEIYPDNNKLHYALWRMMNPQSKRHERSYNISSTEYARRREIQREEIRKLGLSNKGKKQTADSVAKRIISNTGKKRTSETIEKLKQRPQSTKGIKKSTPWNVGRVHSDETKQKMSNSQKGKITSAETRRKISESVKRYKNTLN
jgi:hypothetical protein